MAANIERNCQINITGIEKNLTILTKDDDDGRIFFNKETHTGNTSRLRFRKDNDIVDGIYLITVYPSNGSHAIVLQISNNGKSFDVFEPNGKQLVNANNFYTLEVSVNNKTQTLETSLSPDHDELNNRGICGIWSIIISILLNGIAIDLFTKEDKKLFYDFLNKDKAGAIEFIQNIKTDFFNKTQNFESKSEVNVFLKNIRNLLRKIIDKQKININSSEPRRSKRLKVSKQVAGSSKSTRNKSQNKKRSKTKKRK